MILYLLEFYFRIDLPVYFNRLHRQCGIIGIFAYRIFLKGFIKRRCNFVVGCSEFTLQRLMGSEPFELIKRECLDRYCECSRGLNWVSNGRFVQFSSSVRSCIPIDEIRQEVISDVLADLRLNHL